MNTTLDTPVRDPVTAPPRGSWPEEVISDQRRTIEVLRELLRRQQVDLDRYTGRGALPAPGFAHFETYIAEVVPIVLEYAYSPAEQPVYDAERRDAGPGYPASVWIQRVLVNGKWAAASVVFDQRQMDAFETEIIDAMGG
jgi:hypothetical protein